MKLAKKIFEAIVSSLIVMSSGISSYAVEIPSINWDIKSEKNYEKFLNIMVSNFISFFRNFNYNFKCEIISRLYPNFEEEIFRLRKCICVNLNLANASLGSKNFDDFNVKLNEIFNSMIRIIDCYREIRNKLIGSGFEKNDIFFKKLGEINEIEKFCQENLFDMLNIINYVKSNEKNLREYMTVSDSK